MSTRIPGRRGIVEKKKALGAKMSLSVIMNHNDNSMCQNWDFISTVYEIFFYLIFQYLRQIFIVDCLLSVISYTLAKL